jgi:anaerobic selenocysteine-containing dehydrogenase
MVRMSGSRAHQSAAAVMLEITQQMPQFAGMRYSELAKVERQFPEVGGSDLYYGGTAYKNKGGLGVQMPTSADKGEAVTPGEVKLPKVAHPRGALWVVPTIRLYNRERDFQPSVLDLMQARVPEAYVEINAADAEKLALRDGDFVQVTVGEDTVRARAHVNGAAPKGTVLLPRHLSGDVTPMSLSAGAVTKIGS